MARAERAFAAYLRPSLRPSLQEIRERTAGEPPLDEEPGSPAKAPPIPPPSPRGCTEPSPGPGSIRYHPQPVPERMIKSATPKSSPAQASTAATFYAVIFLIGFFWHGAAQETNDFWRVDPEQGLVTLLWTPLLGVLFGLAVVRGFRALEGRMSWLPALQREFRDLLGRPSGRDLFILAVASSVGEEVLFRGAMLDAWGPWISSLVFAGLHIGPKRSLWPWTLSSLLLGLCLAALTLATGNLGAAIAAHFVINLLNLHYITRKPEFGRPQGHGVSGAGLQRL